MNICEFTHNKLSVGDICDLVRSDSCGAISLRVEVAASGGYRSDGNLVGFSYEMSENRLWEGSEALFEEIRKRWKSVENIAIYHRLGEVFLKEVFTVVAISSPHRSDALEAADMCIVYIKATAPVRETEILEKRTVERQENEECNSMLDRRISWKEILKKTSSSIKNDPQRGIPRIKMFESLDSSVEKPNLFTTQIKASREDIDKRIDKCMRMKRNDLNMMNIREFCGRDVDDNCSCARAVAVFQKRKDRKSYLEVNKVLNKYQYRDNTTSEAFGKFIPRSGIDERLANLECQLGLATPVDNYIYERIKFLEDRILQLESLSPEYIDLWERLNFTSTARTKRRFTIEEIDEMIAALEKKRNDSSVQS